MKRVTSIFLSLIILFGFTQFSSFAAEDSVINIDKELDVYYTAEDAMNRTNKKKVYKPGQYYVYKKDKYSMNISKDQGRPGGWINVEDLFTEEFDLSLAQTSSRLEIEYEMVELLRDRNVYSSLSEALAYKNPTKNYPMGLYYIYKRQDGAVNISPEKGKMGYWISENSLKFALTAPVYEELYFLRDRNVYSKPEDALSYKNSTKNYPAGLYYIYKRQDGAVNISSEKGKMGHWISERSLELALTPPVYEEVYFLRDRNVYSKLKDALAYKNSTDNYPVGVYYIYKRQDGAVNLSAERGKMGHWISERSLELALTPPDYGKVELLKNRNVYSSISEALSYKKPVKNYPEGSYYINRKENGAVNISPEKGKKGYWISEKSLEFAMIEPVYERIYFVRGSSTYYGVNSNVSD
ncbi:MAG: hypothetical protein Q4E50_06100 [Tissierellia bacterium]|nr:hypothetical protein [Tissierellia bacterium]